MATFTASTSLSIKFLSTSPDGDVSIMSEHPAESMHAASAIVYMKFFIAASLEF